MRGHAQGFPVLGALLVIWAVFLAPATLPAQITVEGVADKTVYVDRAAFRVPVAAGWQYTVVLNGAPAVAGSQVEVAQPDYYELSVQRRNLTTQAQESRLFQFIVRSSERVNSEWGLPPWIPYPAIDSAPAEFAGARLQVTAPAAWPLGLEVPVVAWVLDAQGARVGVNGAVRADGLPGHALKLLRGVGHALLPPPAAAGPLAYAARIHGLSADKVIEVEPSTAWTAVSGALTGSADWGEEARVHVTAGLTVPAGAVLTIGAGSVVKLGPGVEVAINGTLAVRGTADRPVVFTPGSRGDPWGGLRFRGSAARADMEWAILTGSGSNPDWFGDNPGSGSSHRDEEPLLYLSGGARATLTDCALIDNFGQAGHGEASFLTMTRCLVQRCITTGQYNGGTVDLRSSALIEFPAEDAPFEDDDNDGLYLTGGSHLLTDCLVGWALDDGIDAGSGTAGSVRVTGCWVESCYHEGMAWSETRIPEVRDTVAINCGQGVECGFGSPNVTVDRCLSTANLTGTRFGDNYDWDYNGFLRVTNSLLLHNRRDVWGRAWDDWSYHQARMDLQANWLSTPEPLHPQNARWDPAADAFRLEPFLPAAPGEVGVGIAVRSERLDAAALGQGLPVRLSTFTTHPVTVDYRVEAAGVAPVEGSLRFEPGETVKRIPLEDLGPGARAPVRVDLRQAVGGELTGLSTAYYLEPVKLVPAGSEWRFFDRGAYPGDGWTSLDFPETGWGTGRAELGFGDDDETTPINGGPATARFWTAYFRRRFPVEDPGAFENVLVSLRRDDGAVVYLNGEEVFRSNMPEEDISYSTPAESTQTSETAFFLETIAASLLRPGDNIVAVEVHQANTTSSDMSFELELVGNPALPLAGAFLRGDSNGDGAIDVSDAVLVLLVLFTGTGSDCHDALDVNDDEALGVDDAIALLNFLFREGAGPRPPYPQRGPDPGGDALDCGQAAAF